MAKPQFAPGMASANKVSSLINKDTITESKGKATYNFQFIPRDKIEPSDKNKKYSQKKIEELIRLDPLGLNSSQSF